MRLVWKELRQQRGAVLLGMGAGIIWPIIEMTLSYAERKVWFTNWGSGIVAGGGAVFAVFLAVATGHADLRQGIDRFWQTRPIRAGQMFVAKLLVGMVLLAIAFTVIMAPEIWIGLRGGTQTRGSIPFVWTVFWMTWSMAALVFGAGLFFVALTRDMAKAAFVTIWFGLLVYILPLFFDVLRPINVFERLDRPDLWFPVGMTQAAKSIWAAESLSFWVKVRMLARNGHVWIQPGFLASVGIPFGAALAFTVLAAQAVKRNWRWRPGFKTIVWTLGVSAALAFAVFKFQVRSDLVPAQHKAGQALVNPMPLKWVSPPLPQVTLDRGGRLFRASTGGQICHDGHLYVVETAYESRRPLGYKDWNTPVYKHWVLQTYRFPAIQETDGDPCDLDCGSIVLCSMEEKEGRSSGWNCGSHVRGDRLYVVCPIGSHKTPNSYVCTLDISNPKQPRLIGTIEIEGEGHLVGRGDHAYLLGSSQLTVLSLNQQDQPTVAAQWTSKTTRSTRGIQPQLPIHLREPNSIYLPCSFRSQIVGDRLLCTDGYAIAILDLSDPNDPMLVYYEDYQKIEQFKRNTHIAAIAVDQDCLYISTQQGLIVRRLIRHADGHWSSERSGFRAATPLERLSGRDPLGLMFHRGYLVEASRDFGMLVYDVSDPARPRRVLHNDTYAERVGLWEGLLYSVGNGDELTLYKLPDRR